MFRNGTGPMWWGISIVLAFTAAVSLRFSPNDGLRTADVPSHVVPR
jgi:hypothetical protein